MTQENKEKPDWVENHLAFLRGLKTTSDAQKAFISLAEKKERTPKEDRIFALIVKSEKVLERSNKARAAVSSMLSKEKNAEAAQERKERTHKLIQLGLLFSYAGLDEAPRDFLAGLVAVGAQTPESERQNLIEYGAKFLAEKESKEAAPIPAKVAAPAPAPAPVATASAPSPKPLTSNTDTWLTTEFKDRDIVRSLGAKWHVESKKWFVPAGNDLEPFKQWMK